MTLELRDITKQVGAEPHIHPTSVTMDSGGFNILLGATNAGKTSLIKLIAGLEKPTSGQVCSMARTSPASPPQRRRVALVHQFFVNYPHMTVAENIASPCASPGWPQKTSRPGLPRPRPSSASPPTSRAAPRNSPVVSNSAQRWPGPSSRRRYCSAGRAAGQSGLQAPRRAAGPVAPPLRGPRCCRGLCHIGTDRGADAGRPDPRASRRSDHPGRPDRPDLSRSRRSDHGRGFSDPPINRAEISKHGGELRLGSLKWPAPAHLIPAPDGRYVMAVRPHFVTPESQAATVPQSR